MSLRISVGALAVVAMIGAPGVAWAQQAVVVDPDPWFGVDKAKHFTVSTLLGGGGYALSLPFTDRTVERAVFGGGLSIAVGGAKELFDLAGFGDPSWKDFTWDVIGTAVGVGIAVTIDLAFASPTPVTRVAPAGGGR